LAKKDGEKCYTEEYISLPQKGGALDRQPNRTLHPTALVKERRLTMAKAQVPLPFGSPPLLRPLLLIQAVD